MGGTVGVAPERAVSFSSGGFSDIFPAPDYQKSAVAAYVESIGDTFDGLYNPAGRGFPDIAAQGRNFSVISQGQLIKVGGTSASAPTFAAIVSLLNNARIKSGQSPLGFLNPWLYSDAVNGGLTDIVLGGSTGCTGRDSTFTAPFYSCPRPLVFSQPLFVDECQIQEGPLHKILTARLQSTAACRRPLFPELGGMLPQVGTLSQGSGLLCSINC